MAGLLDQPVKPNATSTHTTFASVLVNKAGPGISPRASCGPAQGSSGIKQIVNQAVSEACHTNAMKEKENTSIVIYGIKKTKNDMSDVKDITHVVLTT